ncbi:predicted protein [Sclerotinia sclerotiorum 1980 UF-70]|uniref:Uncharacterized protein n=1 Tax=Sclerotinia sclerotiorum (strain ATCC 18683 / 1980 / Ss-1) TaxID=665079 RepID=A7EIB0_SCLS1|nr:predicted protein [Sclerotinia sclerotiorum 1980 UF-70]EDO02576.1 predicted protein [Sclerotinia sclerotiorum 1980 UF-70]
MSEGFMSHLYAVRLKLAVSSDHQQAGPSGHGNVSHGAGDIQLFEFPAFEYWPTTITDHPSCRYSGFRLHGTVPPAQQVNHNRRGFWLAPAEVFLLLLAPKHSTGRLSRRKGQVPQIMWVSITTLLSAQLYFSAHPDKGRFCSARTEEKRKPGADFEQPKSQAVLKPQV